ncbi:hypothetical protein BH23BAC3_BH23BAC3_23250 [soil metagenome]
MDDSKSKPDQPKKKGNKKNKDESDKRRPEPDDENEKGGFPTKEMPEEDEN